jgi:adenylate cyclase
MKLSVQKYEMEKEIRLPRHTVWKLLSDTDHLNRVIGLFPVEPGQAAHTRSELTSLMNAKAAGIVPILWTEYPFEWQIEERYAVLRIYSKGPLARFYAGVEMRDSSNVLPDGANATMVRLFAHVTPANLIGMLSLPLMTRQSMNKTFKYFSDYQKLLLAGIQRRPQPESQYRVNLPEADRLLFQLEMMPVEQSCVPLLKDRIIYHGDDEVVDMRPYGIADEWNVSRVDVLRLFLYATKIGLLNLSWHLICPNCRVSKYSAESLSLIKEQFHCDFCGINYNLQFDKYVELCFSVHPNIRKANAQVYCIGGPAITPHVFAQCYVEKGKDGVIDCGYYDESVRIRVLKYNHIVNIHTEREAQQESFPGPGERVHLHYDEQGWDTNEVVLPASGSALHIHNAAERDIVVALEKADWDDMVVTAAKVSTMYEFRGMFSSEVLAPGTQIGVESLTFLFSDLLGSTIFYETVGDARAYGQVRRHFDFMEQWIHKSQGTIVKTMGDAVMAIFETPENALQAAIDIQTHVDEFNQGSSNDDRIVIKIGLHHGAAIAVNSNDKIDYFGQTVNIASRIQSLSKGGDIVLSKETSLRVGMKDLLERSRAQVARFDATVKGIDQSLGLIRVLVK